MAIGYGKPRKQSGPRSWYANWGGHGADPDLDPELFAELPVIVQKQKLALKKILEVYPDARAFHTIDPGTGQPYPGQGPLMRDLCRKHYPHLFCIETKEPDPIELPPVLIYNVPQGVPLMWLQRERRKPRLLPNEELQQEIVGKLISHLSDEGLRAHCTVEGEGKAFLEVKPLDGVYAYIWRCARFAAGVDPSLPTTLHYDLEDGIEAITGHCVSVTPQLRRALEGSVKKLCRMLGMAYLFKV